jgi:uncharacterized protein
MVSRHRPLDQRSPLVIDTHDLGRGAGALKHIRRTVEAPAELGIDVIAVPQGSALELDLMLESVIEGVLVSGTVRGPLLGECARCLTSMVDEIDVEVQELYVHTERETDDEEVRRLDGDLLDLEPLLRDAIVVELPFRPLCSEDCQGLCAECGADLNVDPDHAHDTAVDPRWATLTDLYDVERNSNT